MLLWQQLIECCNEFVGFFVCQVNQFVEICCQFSVVEQDLVESEVKCILLVIVLESGIVIVVFVEVGQIVDSLCLLLSIVFVDILLQVEFYVLSKFIGFIWLGDVVLICYQVYLYQKFGQYYGKVQLIFCVSVFYVEFFSMVGGVLGFGQDGEQLYWLWVIFDDQVVIVYGQLCLLQSGMLLDVDIFQDIWCFYEWVLELFYSLIGKFQE